MTRTALFILAIATAIISFAQENNSGTIVYEQIVKLEIKLEGEAAQYASMMPKERKSEKTLIFNAEASLFENAKSNANDDMAMHSGGGNVMIKMAEPENKLYTNFNTKSSIEMREFMTRFFLIEGEINYPWKLSGNQKLILEYPCQEATMTDGEKKVIAWFTPVIPVSGGPSKYSGLPGLILSVEIDEGKQVLTAKSIDLTPVAKESIVKPEKGKKVTQEEFKTIMDEKMKEMGGQNGIKGGTQIMIRMH